MNGKQFIIRNSSTENFFLLCLLFIVFVALGVLRSMGWSLTSIAEDKAELGWVTIVGYALLFILCISFIWVIQAPERATYLLGSSAALGVFPKIPGLPFLQDVTHVALALFVIANWRNLHPWMEIRTPTDLRLKAFLTFLFISTASVIINFMLRGDVWQLKVGISGLFLLGLLFVALSIMIKSPTNRIFSDMYDGFLDSAKIATVLGVIVITLSLVTPYSTGIEDDGRDTLWGLEYFDRLKLMFDGPGIAASYFVGAMAFVIYALSQCGSTIKGWSRNWLLFLVQALPWLVVASGSRVGRIALAILILAGLLWSPVRRASLIALPMTIAALLIMMDFQSFPSAVKYSLGHIFPEHFNIEKIDDLRLHARLFALEERGDLLKHSISALQEESMLRKIIGIGYGITGYRTSPYPSPHNLFLGLIIQVGILGFLSYFLFWFICTKPIFTSAKNLNSSEQGVRWAFCISLVSILGLAVSYEVQTRGWVLMLLLMMHSWLNFNKKSHN